MCAAYYNEVDPVRSDWLRGLIALGELPAGHVDNRDIRDVQPSDLDGFTHLHFFAGIGGWALATTLAGWPAETEICTVSCPCQPWSIAGKGLGHDDPRHLWPEFYRLARARRPTRIVGEQVTRANGRLWLDDAFDDLDRLGYTSRAVRVPACAVGSPQERERLFFVACADSEGLQSAEQPERSQPGRQAAEEWPAVAQPHRSTPWAGGRLLQGADGKLRLGEPRIPLLAHGIPQRVVVNSGFGDAIIPLLAAEVILALRDIGADAHDRNAEGF